MEFKGDENLIFQLSKNFWLGKIELPWWGPPSSAGLDNPPIGFWTYIFLGLPFGTENPMQICLGSRLLNCLGLGLLFLLGVGQSEKNRRDLFLWTLALVCVNPFQVLWQRKIWVQSLFPFYLCLFFFVWSYRKKVLSVAILAGFCASIASGIHLAGLMFFGLFLLFELISECFFTRDFIWKRWIGITLGFMVGLIPQIPWLIQVTRFSFLSNTNPMAWEEIVRFRYWRFFVTEPFGLKLTYSLGIDHYQEFLRSYASLPQICEWILILLLVFFLAILGKALVLMVIDPQRRSREWSQDRLQFWMLSSIFGFGCLLSLVTMRTLVHRHYLLACYPIPYLFLVYVISQYFRYWKVFLSIALLAQFLLTLFFLLYIHEHEGTSNREADYGKTFSYQVRNKIEI